MKINTQRLKRRWKWYAAYIVIFMVSFVLFYANDCAQDEQTEQILESARSHSVSPDNTAMTSINAGDEVPAFDQADLNQENHK
ncbi:hypothetical protein [Acinetobacter baumannii]|uniref:hypothetical protein n=1 Tax=Acinetobacter baumannii TaxID=470 RepID=UPI000460D3A5|nr:hypothetical protein [Acinetobacter baumannii]EJB8497429.1 hypothetical protein [Acinetobacter baumannii]ELB0341888.1 hypothetical protein [Acinetobacter baumannii]KCY24382.1 hypothetical protein J635_0083 [Acinetobacter baumannii 233846]OTM39663.1 hypothetical protein B9X46_16115 [Acinetobacter baumannii]TPS05128.1 hypothetical protein FJV14_01795 [Acinetobacter baumannii]